MRGTLRGIKHDVLNRRVDELVIEDGVSLVGSYVWEMTTNRRSFIGGVGAIATAAILRPDSLAAAAPQASAPWDLTWIDALKGKHRQVFDLGSRDLGNGRNPLRIPRNYLNGFNGVYGIQDRDLNTIIGITSDAFPMNASNALYARFGLGERWKIKDPATGTWATRNIWLENAPQQAEASIHVLQSRGTIFWQCNNALLGLATELSTAMGMTREQTRAELVAGLLPGVKLVPAHTMALGLVQEKGFTYEKL